MYSDTLLRTYPLISDQVDKRELGVVLRELEKHLQRGETGSVVEFGCYAGTTSLFIRRLLDQYHSSAEFHVYDSFVGLPPKTSKDQSAAGEQFVTGELAVAKKEFIANFRKAGLRTPVIHRGWFNAVTPDRVPEAIFFAFLDGDYYESIRDSLMCIAPKLATRTTIIVDDYANEALPGAARATDEWVARGAWHLRTEASLAVLAN